MPASDVVVSVVVPAYRAAATLPAAVAALLAQEFDPGFEVVVVASADDPSGLPGDIGNDPRLRLLAHVPRLGAAAARNRGVAASRGTLLAFTDADVIVTPGWLASLVKASDGGRRLVGGSVRNGTPESAAGTAEYLVQFLDLHPARPPATAWHGATCNLLVPRSLWERLGPFPEDMGGGEDTLLTVRAGREGLFCFAPGAVVDHLCRTRLRDVVAHQYAFGRFTAELARRSPLKHGWLLRHPLLAPLATAGRVISLYARVAAWLPGSRWRALALFPAVSAALVAWGCGLAREGLKRRDRPRAERDGAEGC